MRSARFPIPLILLHWLMLALIAIAYATMELRGYFPRGSGAREAMKAWHYAIGLTVFGLVWLRLVFRLALGAPEAEALAPRWARLAGAAVHGVLYLLMIALPLVGWLLLGAEGNAVALLGIELPSLVGQDEALADRLGEVHELLGKAGYALIGLHAAAAVFHHYVLRDRAMARMLPGRAGA